MFAIYIVMPQIVDIKIIKGRRAEAIEEDNIRNNMLRKRVEAECPELKNPASRARQDPRYNALYEKKTEVSIEQQILDLIKDGWEIKGGLIVSSPNFFQTMVLYEGSVLTEDLLSLETTDEPVLNITELTPQITTN
jgi:hypothetical protein